MAVEERFSIFPSGEDHPDWRIDIERRLAITEEDGVRLTITEDPGSVTSDQHSQIASLSVAEVHELIDCLRKSISENGD